MTIALNILLGLVMLCVGADFLVRGASSLAVKVGVRPIVIGMTVVAFGTSLPEAMVSILASLQAKPGIAVGNVVGSNIANIALILGVSALIRPLKVEALSIRHEVPFVIVSSLLLWGFSADSLLGRAEGVVLLCIFAGFIWSCFRKTGLPSDAEFAGKKLNSSLHVIFVLCGLLMLAVGANRLVSGSVSLANLWGVSGLVVGLTVVAVGTSLPELATSLMASIRGQDDISVGNVIGSNAFNTLLILGVCAVIRPMDVGGNLLSRDLPVLCIASLALLPILKTGFRITRFEGGILLFFYTVYIIALVKTASPHSLHEQAL